MPTDNRPDPPAIRLVEGVDYTIENGKWVFTAAFLLKRGQCCESDCRNCPYRNQTANPPEHDSLD